jgi:hypothetical protein
VDEPLKRYFRSQPIIYIHSRVNIPIDSVQQFPCHLITMEGINRFIHSSSPSEGNHSWIWNFDNSEHRFGSLLHRLYETFAIRPPTIYYQQVKKKFPLCWERFPPLNGGCETISCCPLPRGAMRLTKEVKRWMSSLEKVSSEKL